MGFKYEAIKAYLIDHGVDFITTNVPVELQEILQ